jgi:hypothetical protein
VKSEPAIVYKTYVFVGGHNQVVKKPNLQNLGGLKEPASDVEVFVGGACISVRVVVRKDNAGGVQPACRPKDISGVQEAFIKRSAAHHLSRDEAVVGVKTKDPGFFDLGALQVREKLGSVVA